MYFRDINNQFSTAQAVTATAKGTDCIPTSATSVNTVVDMYNDTTAPWVEFLVTEAATAAGAATVVLEVVTADSEANLTSAAGTDILAQTEAIGKATLIIGYKRQLRLPVGPYKQFVGVRYTVATGPLTAGKFDAYVVPAITRQRTYADGSSIQ